MITFFRRLIADTKFSAGRVSNKIWLSYIFDYVIIVVLAIIFLCLDKVNGFRQPFAPSDTSLQYPFAKHERLPAGWCYVVVVICPAILIAIWTLAIDGVWSRRGYRRYTVPERLWELNCGILGLALSEGMAFVVTGTFKNTIGRPRPDLISRCNPDPAAIDPTPWKLSDSSICRQSDEAILKDGFRSFPSGHSSSAFAGLFYLSLWLAAKLHIWDSKGQVWKMFVVIIPSVGAGLVAASRIMDARHHAFDVLSGSALGIACAYAAYRQYFPAISDTRRKGRAYKMRSWGEDGDCREDANQSLPHHTHTQPRVAVDTAYQGTSYEGPERVHREGSDDFVPFAARGSPMAEQGIGKERHDVQDDDEGDDDEVHAGTPLERGPERYEMRPPYEAASYMENQARR